MFLYYYFKELQVNNCIHYMSTNSTYLFSHSPYTYQNNIIGSMCFKWIKHFQELSKFGHSPQNMLKFWASPFPGFRIRSLQQSSWLNIRNSSILLTRPVTLGLFSNTFYIVNQGPSLLCLCLSRVSPTGKKRAGGPPESFHYFCTKVTPIASTYNSLAILPILSQGAP